LILAVTRAKPLPPAPTPRAALPAAALARLRKGDAAAFEQVYDAYRARVYGFLLRLTRDASLAQDLAQETWLRLAANARTLTPDTELHAWLFKVARNLFVSQRRWAIFRENGLRILHLLPPSAAIPSPLEEAAAGELGLRVERALLGLPLHYREVVLLVAVEGLSSAEVAQLLGVSHAAVRQRLARGRAAVVRSLEEET
jgi:RNA polymerase sigma-70 factor (ECF subfamily)